MKNDIVLLTSLEVSRDVTLLDLNNYNLTTLRENVSAIDVKYGNLILTGKGSIVAYGLNSAAIRVKGAIITAGNSNYAHVTQLVVSFVFSPLIIMAFCRSEL